MLHSMTTRIRWLLWGLLGILCLPAAADERTLVDLSQLDPPLSTWFFAGFFEHAVGGNVRGFRLG